MPFPTSLQVILLIILIASSALVVIKGILELLTFIKIKQSGNLVQAKIVDFKEDRSGDGVTFPAVVSYTTTTGEKIIATSKNSSGIKPAIGKEVWIIYSSTDPSHFYFEHSIFPYLTISMIVMFGTAVILLIVELFKVV